MDYLMELRPVKKTFRGPLLNPGVSAPKTRSVTGPTPHSVSILDRPKLTRPPDWRTLDRLKKEDVRDVSVQLVAHYDRTDQFNDFIERTDKKILHNTIQRKVDSLLLQQQFSLDERRERLRDLLEYEEEQQLAELVSMQETQLERQARMRERARTLKEKREAERQAIVEEKLSQRWREQCEELRSYQTQRHLKEVTKDRDEQLRLKEEKKKVQEKEEAAYARMWKEDWAIKCKREDMEAAMRIERNKEAFELLNTQMAAIEKQREDMKLLKEKEAELRREEVALREIEDQKMQEEKRRRQLETKMMLDYSLKLKLRRRAKEVQEELAFDMQLLEQMLTQNTNEAKEALEEKKRLKNESQMYRAYLKEQAEEEERREKELDAIVNAEVERQWAKRAAQWKKEAQARKKLLQDVLDTRKQQVKEKLDAIAKEKAALEKEGEEMKRILAEHEALEKQQKAERDQVNKAYQRDLVQQREYIELTKKLEKQELVEDWEACLEAEAEYHKRVQEEQAKPWPSPLRPHPTTLVLTGKGLV